MRWDYQIAPDAWASFRRLDVNVQEALLDRLETLGDTLENLMASGSVQLDVQLDAVGETVKLSLLVNRRRGSFVLTEVGP